MKFLIFNLALIAIALGIARQMGITIPRPHIPAPCTKEFALIIAAQAIISFFSSYISKLLTDQPKRYQGDEDGVLDVKLLENRRRQNQGILLFTIGFMSIIILVAHLFCQDGPWKGPPSGEDGKYALMIVFGSIGEFLALIFAVASESLGPNWRGRVKIPLSETRANLDLVFFLSSSSIRAGL
jgi:hypothetical protein